MMKAIDILLNALLPALILLHLFVSPYTKVEESFPLQATHDLIHHLSSPFSPLTPETFDHLSFPGAVPRTFLGSLILAIIAKPILLITGTENDIYWAQVIVRGVLGLFNAGSLLVFKRGLERVFGKDVGRWWVLLLGSQFHVIYYASRTLTNMFAFGLTTLALQDFFAKKPNSLRTPQQNRIGISLLVFAGVIFRSEIALLLFVQLGYLLVQFRIPLRTVIYTGLTSFVLAQAISIPIDSYLWQRFVWPELSAFLFNVVQGKSEEWGTSPYGYYFGSLLPKLLVNPLILILLVPLSYIIPAIKFPSRDLVTPSILFIAIYSFQPHKEARFIIYVVPALTAAASLSASYIWTRRSKSILYRLGSLLIAGSILASFAASTIMLLISCLNYPGGEALSQLHHLLNKDPSLISSNRERDRPVRIHMDVLSCMTGVTRFQQYPSFDAAQFPKIAGRKTEIIYDKTEDSDELLQPSWWDQFDFALMEEPGKAIGPWEVIGTVYSYAELEFLRPGVRSLSSTEKLYGAYNSTKEGEEVLGSEEVVEKVKEMNDWRVDYEDATTFQEIKERVLQGGLNLSKAEIVWCVRDAVRLLTGGWWIGPRLEPKIRILTRGEVILSYSE